MKIKFTLLIIFLTRVAPSLYSQTQLNHHEYGVSNPFINKYTLPHSGHFNTKDVYISGGVYNDPSYEFVDAGVDAFLVKTNLDGLPIFNKHYGVTNFGGNLSLKFHAVTEIGGDVFATGLLANNQWFGLVKLDASNGSIISHSFYETPSTNNIFGTNFNFCKILPKPNSTNILVIGSANFLDAAYSIFTRKAVVLEYDNNLNLINFNYYQLPQNVIGPTLTEETFTVTDALIHKNDLSNLEELVLVGESNFLDKYIGTPYNHISACMLRIDANSLVSLTYSYYPHVFNPSPLSIEGSIATTVTELDNSLFVTGSIEHLIGRMALFILKTDEMGLIQNYEVLNMRGSDPNAYITRPISIYAKKANNNMVLSVAGEIRGASYVNSFSPLKYNASNSVFTLDYDLTNSQILYSKTFDAANSTGLYLSDVLKINNNNFVHIGSNFNSTSSILTTNNSSTAFFVNQINSDEMRCVKQDEDVTNLNLTLGYVSSRGTNINPSFTPITNISIVDYSNNDDKICEETIAQMMNVESEVLGALVDVFDLTTSELIKSYSVELNNKQFCEFNMHSLSKDINLIQGRLYAVKMTCNNQSSRIFKFTY